MFYPHHFWGWICKLFLLLLRISLGISLIPSFFWLVECHLLSCEGVTSLQSITLQLFLYSTQVWSTAWAVSVTVDSLHSTLDGVCMDRLIRKLGICMGEAVIQVLTQMFQTCILMTFLGFSVLFSYIFRAKLRKQLYAIEKSQYHTTKRIISLFWENFTVLFK